MVQDSKPVKPQLLIGSRIITQTDTYSVKSILGPVVNVTCNSKRGWYGRLDLDQVKERVKAGLYKIDNSSI